MELTTLLLLVAVGCAAGTLAGFFGVGGGIVLVPILLWFYQSILSVPSQVSAHLTLGTSLFIVVLTSLSSVIGQYRNGHVVLKAAVVIGATSVFAAFAGSQLAAVLPGKILLQIFSGVLALTASMLVFGPKPEKEERMMNLSPGSMVVTGVVTGMASAMTGLGGGVISIPMMYYLMGFPLKKALGTSSATIVLTAGAAAIGYVYSGLNHPDLEAYRSFTLGYVDYVHSLPLIAGTLPTAFLGTYLAHKTRTAVLRKLFACLLFVVAIRIFFL